MYKIPTLNELQLRNWNRIFDSLENFPTFQAKQRITYTSKWTKTNIGTHRCILSSSIPISGSLANDYREFMLQNCKIALKLWWDGLQNFTTYKSIQSEVICKISKPSDTNWLRALSWTWFREKKNRFTVGYRDTRLWYRYVKSFIL